MFCYTLLYVHSSIAIILIGKRAKKNPPAVKFLDLIFRNNFLSSILAKCVFDESCRGEFPPTSPKGLVLMAQIEFCVYI